ncbi:MAG: CopG family transcriptional regulator [Candidatus Heimdallarchaeota archaeon]|nr:CopG family transcriptional regulator [Candidatus Heimdallarchaeota archaeon]
MTKRGNGKKKKEPATTISVDKDTMIIVNELKKKLGIKNASEMMRMAVREKYDRDVNLGIDLPTLYQQFREFKLDVYRMMMNQSIPTKFADNTVIAAEKSVDPFDKTIESLVGNAMSPYTKLIEESTKLLLQKIDQNQQKQSELERTMRENIPTKKLKN